MFYARHKVVPLPTTAATPATTATFDDSMNKLSPAAVCLIVSIRVAAALHTTHGAGEESHLTEQDPLPKCLVSIFLNLLPSKISIAFHQ